MIYPQKHSLPDGENRSAFLLPLVHIHEKKGIGRHNNGSAVFLPKECAVMLWEMAGELLSRVLYLILNVSGGSFPRPLSAEEEAECLRRLARGDREARNTLIEHNLRLVAHIIKKYYASWSDQEDLVSIGTIGLIKAVNTFDASKGARLSSYAARCIENAILS